MNYKQQFDKLTEAYANNKVSPYDSCACFVGNMLNGNDKWISSREGNTLIGFIMKNLEYVNKAIEEEAEGYYTAKEIFDIEFVFMYTIRRGVVDTVNYVHSKNWEDILFEGFEAALELLKEIHISKGEDIDSQFIPKFVKRELHAIHI